jgi:flagellar basal body-associated protein FliL
MKYADKKDKAKKILLIVIIIILAIIIFLWIFPVFRHSIIDAYCTHQAIQVVGVQANKQVTETAQEIQQQTGNLEQIKNLGKYKISLWFKEDLKCERNISQFFRL